MRIAPVALPVLALVAGGWLGQRQGQSPPDAVTADPAHYRLESENSVARVLRVAYGPGERSVMHTHPALCAVFLTGASFRFTLPDNTTQDVAGTPGQVLCLDAATHLPQNVGPARAELILIEFKNKRTFQP